MPATRSRGAASSSSHRRSATPSPRKPPPPKPSMRGISGWDRRPRLSFDHLIGAGQEHRGHLEAEGLGGFQIDDELEPGELENRQFGRFGALEDLSGVNARLAISVRQADAVTHQA